MSDIKNVLHMQHITMQFGGVVAVNGLTLDVNEHEIVALIVDTLCATRPTIRIGGDYISAAVVRERFFRLTYEHLEYVFECLRRNTTEIRNIRGYLLTALYNAPVTINHHYQAEVQHDLDG